MANKNFNIRKGIYIVPNVGRIDATKEVSDEKAYEAYKVSRKKFPFISLAKEGANFIKKQKPTAEDVARMILNAKTAEEVELLSTLSDTKKVEGVKETKLNILKSESK